VQPS
jgi:hypothetical protein